MTYLEYYAGQALQGCFSLQNAGHVDMASEARAVAYAMCEALNVDHDAHLFNACLQVYPQKECND